MIILLPIFIVLSAPFLIIPLTWWSIEWGIAAVIVLLPTYLLRSEPMAGIPTTGLELTIYGLAIGAVLHWVLRGGWQKPRISKQAWSMLLLWITAWVIATAWSTDHRASLGALKAWLVDPLVFGYILLCSIRTTKHITTLLSAIALSGTVVAIAGFMQYLSFPDSVQDGRLSSFFAPVANYAAMFLAPILVVTIAAILWKQLSRRWWVSVVIMAVAVALTVSFGGYLAVGVGLMVIWSQLSDRQLQRRLLISLVSIGIIGAVILFTTPYVKEKINFTDRSSSLVRTQIWRTSIEMIREHPIVGIGPNAYENVYRATIPRFYFPPLEWLVAQPHQLYLALWLETGLLGLITFVFGVGMWIRQTWKRAHQQNALAIISLAGMLVILVHGFVDTPIFKNDLMLVFAILLLLPYLGRSEKSETKN
jgi:O-antigen ligase